MLTNTNCRGYRPLFPRGQTARPRRRDHPPAVRGAGARFVEGRPAGVSGNASSQKARRAPGRRPLTHLPLIPETRSRSALRRCAGPSGDMGPKFDR